MEEELKKIYDELESDAYNIEYHTYDYKITNQIIRRNFEKLFKAQTNKGGQAEVLVKPFATEICIAHVKDGIEEYNRVAYEKCKKQLLKIIAILYHAQIDIKVKDIIPVEKGDVYWYKIKERTLDLGEALRITYWVDDLG